MKLDFNEVNELVTKIAGKWSRKCSMEYEDFYQELWVKALEIDNLENASIPLLATSLVNHSKNLLRIVCKDSNNIHSFTPDVDEEYIETYIETHTIYEAKSSKDSVINEIPDYLSVLESINKLSDESRKFAIAKICLNTDDATFRNEFTEMLSQLNDKQKEMLANNKRGYYADNVIFKTFCNIKQGATHARARKIKDELRTVLLAQ